MFCCLKKPLVHDDEEQVNAVRVEPAAVSQAEKQSDAQQQARPAPKPDVTAAEAPGAPPLPLNDVDKKWQAPGAPPLPLNDVDKKWQERKGPETVDDKQWKDLGGSNLEPLLDDIDLVDLQYIIDLTEAGIKVPRWQDVPLGARINRQNLTRIQKTFNPFVLPVLVLSYPWLDPEHPDKELNTLRRLLPALKAVEEGAAKLGEGHTVGLMMDYPCLPQRAMNGQDDRTDEEKARFKRALGSINEWYKHPHTTVLVYDVDLPGKEECGHTNLRPYAMRGWCSFEFRASCLVKSMFCLWSLKGYEKTKFGSWAAAVQSAKSGVLRAAPMKPDEFSAMLNDGIKSGEIAFTSKADLDVVTKQYDAAFVSAFTEVTALIYANLEWDDEHVLQLASALTYAKECGLMKKCQRVSLTGNKCTQVGKDAVKKALEGTNIIVNGAD